MDKLIIEDAEADVEERDCQETDADDHIYSLDVVDTERQGLWQYCNLRNGR